MKTKNVVWFSMLAAAFALTVCLKYLPFLPGDIVIARFIQSSVPASLQWAELLSSTAKMPWILILVALTFFLSWVIAGWRASLLSLAAFIGLWLLGTWLGPVVAQPRPSPELVRVTGSLPGSAFPSVFAFNYISTVGFIAVLAAVKTSGGLRWILLTVCSLILVSGAIARVALAAHWPSDVAVSYLIGLLWVTALLRFI